MSDIDKIIPKAQTVLESIKKMFSLLAKESYFAALKEFINLFKVTYVNYLKGRYITLKGKKIPLTAVVCAAVLVLYAFYPSGEDKAVEPEKPTISEAEMVAQSNYYNQDDIIIDHMHKCNEAACGNLENTKENEITEVNIPVAFFNKEGVLIYEGNVKVSHIPPQETIQFKVSSQVPFSFFKLGIVEVK